MTREEIKRTVRAIKNARKEFKENPEKALKVIIKAGILNKKGELAKGYKQ